MTSRVSRKLSPLLLALAAAGCVTINIYFPAAAAEKAADKIIDEVWQIQKEKEKEKDKDRDKDAARKPEPSSGTTKP